MNCSMDLPILEIYMDGMNKEKDKPCKKGKGINFPLPFYDNRGNPEYVCQPEEETERE